MPTEHELKTFLIESISTPAVTLEDFEVLISENKGDKVEPIIKSRTKASWSFDDLYYFSDHNNLINKDVYRPLNFKGITVETYEIITSTQKGKGWLHNKTRESLAIINATDEYKQYAEEYFLTQKSRMGKLYAKNVIPDAGVIHDSEAYNSLVKHRKEAIDKMDARFGQLYERYRDMDVVTVAADPEARSVGAELFKYHCATCHGANAKGSSGFPNLRDNDWLYGGAPDTIEQTILDGRVGVMPAWGDALGGDVGVVDVAEYVFSLSGRNVDQASAARGQEKFAMLCVACHGAGGTGNQALGAPNLTDNIWLYGGSGKQVMESIAKGRAGVMPAHKDILDEGKIHFLTAYVFSLSDGQKGKDE